MARRLSWCGFLLLAAVCSASAATHVVLPFSNLTRAPGLDWIGESIAENVGDALHAEGLLVLDREDRREAYRRLSLREYAPLTLATVVKIGEALDADFVIFGQFSVAGEGSPGKRTIRLSGRVLDLKNLRQSAEFSQTAPLEDLALLQVNLSWDAYRFLRPESARQEGEFKRSLRAVRVDAMEYYIRGLLASTDEQRHRCFAQAARLDEGFSQPRFQLGRLHWNQKNYQVAAEWLKQVSPADPHAREAKFLLGLALYRHGEFAAAAEAFAEVSRQLPLNEVFNNLGVSQLRRGEPAALENLRRALDSDDADPVYHFNVGYALWMRGEFAEAADRFRAVLDRNPEDSEATLMLGRCLRQTRARPADAHLAPGPRLKLNFDETAYRQLKEILESQKP